MYIQESARIDLKIHQFSITEDHPSESKTWEELVMDSNDVNYYCEIKKMIES